MQQAQQHYFLSPILVYDGPNLKLAMTRALVSPSGIYKVFEENEQSRRDFLAALELKVRLDGQDYRARLVRELGPQGAHYNLRLLRPRKEHLQELLGRYGFASPWKRDYARLPTGNLLHLVETPMRAEVQRFSGFAMARVRNFSYHGLFLELECANPSLGEAVNQIVRFRITTSKGRILDSCTARIARIYDEMVKPGSLRRGLGLRILDMPENTRKAYHDMILASCKEHLKKG